MNYLTLPPEVGRKHFLAGTTASIMGYVYREDGVVLKLVSWCMKLIHCCMVTVEPHIMFVKCAPLRDCAWKRLTCVCTYEEGGDETDSSESTTSVL